MAEHPFTKRPVTNLTAEMAMEHFGGMQALRLRQNEAWSRIPRDIPHTARQILRYLGVPESVFCTPPREKMASLRI